PESHELSEVRIMSRRSVIHAVYLLGACAMTAAAHGQKQESAKTPAEGVQITVELPKEEPTVEQVNDGSFTIRIVLKNASTQDLTLWPFLSAELVDADGNAVRRSRRLGRFGRRPEGSILENIPFRTLKPGESHQSNSAISQYFLDPNVIT